MNASPGTIAEELRLELAMGLIEPDNVTAWADSIILQQPSLPGWVYDLSLAVGKDPKVINSLLCEVPRSPDELKAGATHALGHLARLVEESALGTYAAADALWSWARNADIDEVVKRDASTLGAIADDVKRGHFGTVDGFADDIREFLTAIHAEAASRE